MTQNNVEKQNILFIYLLAVSFAAPQHVERCACIYIGTFGLLCLNSFLRLLSARGTNWIKVVTKNDFKGSDGGAGVWTGPALVYLTRVCCCSVGGGRSAGELQVVVTLQVMEKRSPVTSAALLQNHLCK